MSDQLPNPGPTHEVLVPVRFDCPADSGGYGYVYLGDAPVGPADTTPFHIDDDAPSIESIYVVDTDALGALLGIELQSAWQSLPEFVDVPTGEFGTTVDARVLHGADWWELWFGAERGETLWLTPGTAEPDDDWELGVIVSEGGRFIGVTARGAGAASRLPAVYQQG
ncbi:MAG: hypothetical protein JWN72_1379 [Thermoleophilia bacterium]|nr:hypothetical protein [Thermoleophilia bacterium]